MSNSYKPQPHSLEDVKTEVVNATLMVAAIAGSVAYLLSLNRFFQSGFHYSFVIELMIMLCVVVVAIYRKRLRNDFKASVVIGLILLFSLSDAIAYGLFSSARAYLLLVPFFAVLFYSTRIALALFAGSILSFLVVGYMHYTGHLKIPENYEPAIYVLRMYPWIINAIHVGTVALVLVLITRRFINSFHLFIQQLQQANELLVLQERNYREIFNSTSDAIFIHHPNNGTIIDANEAVLDMYGFRRQQIAGLHMRDFCSDNAPFDSQTALAYLERAAHGEILTFDWHAKKKNGDLFWASVVLKEASIGGEKRILAMVRDVSDKKKTELELEKYRHQLEELVQERTEELETANEELRSMNEELQAQQDIMVDTLDNLQKTQAKLISSEKKASLGVLASGVAHEINNPLNFIAGGVMALENYIHDNLPKHIPQIDPLLKGINEGIKRANNIVVALNQYTRIGEGEYPVACNIHEILDRAIGILESRVPENVRIEKKYTRLGREFTAKQAQLLQAFVNILTNSIQSLEGKGSICLTTCEDVSKLIIEIRDTGAGISPEDLIRVTDPFFTTRSPGEGAGLGLSIAASIIRDHEGEIRIESQLSTGTTVTVILPLNQD